MLTVVINVIVQFENCETSGQVRRPNMSYKFLLNLTKQSTARMLIVLRSVE